MSEYNKNITEIMVISVPKKMEEKIIKNQQNKCARKPYSSIPWLQNYHCLLWKNKNKNIKGTFYKKQYVIIKKDINGDVVTKNLIALCDRCFDVAKLRITKAARDKNFISDSSSESNSSYASDEELENLFVPLKIENKYNDNFIKKKTIPPKLKEKVWSEYIGDKTTCECPVCEEITISAFSFECAHVISEANGGSMELENLRAICSSCNRSMGTRDMKIYVKEFYSKSPILSTFESNFQIKKIDNSELLEQKEQIKIILPEEQIIQPQLIIKQISENEKINQTPLVKKICEKQGCLRPTTEFDFCCKACRNNESFHNYHCDEMLKKSTCKKQNCQRLALKFDYCCKSCRNNEQYHSYGCDDQIKK